MTDQEVINILSKYKNIPWKFVEENVREYLQNRYVDSQSIWESYYRVVNHIDIRPVCKTCGKPVEFVNKRYREYCSKQCILKDPEKQKQKQEKQKQTCLEKYGVEHHMKTQQVKDKVAQTNIERYGFACSAKNEQVKEKQRQTMIEKYGSVSYNNEEKHKQTCLEKYGVEHYTNREQYRKTCIERYNTDNWRKTAQYRKYQSQIMSNSDVQQHIVQTRIINGTYDVSEPEEESYLLLKTKYYDVIRQYKSDKYPYNCDFYIPSLDLYIECNYHWTHGGHPYNENLDITKLAEWQEKSKTSIFYKNAIQTWTIRDVKKRQISQENRLNYIEFWNIDELKDWIEKSIL